MAKVGDAGLWLPSEFLSDKENNGSDADLFAFPSEFPYEFGVSSPAAGSSETESSSDEEEDFLAGLTRRLSLTQSSLLHETRKQLTAGEPAFPTKTHRDLAGSPQSTLSGMGSWSGRSTVSGNGSPNGNSRVPSPSTAPFADSWEVIYAAAGQVARLKMNGQVSHLDFQNNPLGPNNMFSNQILNQVQQQVKQRQQQQCASSLWGRQQAKPNWVVQQQQLQVQNRAREVGYDESGKCNRPLSFPQQSPHHTPLQLQHQNQRVNYVGSGSGFRVAVPGGGSSVKRGSSGGTGVFLPRHYDNTPSDTRKKTTGCAPVLLPSKAVHALNSNIDDLNVAVQQRFSNAFANDYDALLARRNALLMQQRLLSLRREEAAKSNCEIRLPQEWTY